MISLELKIILVIIFAGITVTSLIKLIITTIDILRTNRKNSKCKYYPEREVVAFPFHRVMSYKEKIICVYGNTMEELETNFFNTQNMLKTHQKYEVNVTDEVLNKLLKYYNARVQ